jgi:hypothetical protein
LLHVSLFCAFGIQFGKRQRALLSSKTYPKRGPGSPERKLNFTN